MKCPANKTRTKNSCCLPGLATACFLVLLLGASPAARGDVVWVAGEPGPIFGIIVRVSESEIAFDRRMARGKYKRMQLKTSDVVAFHKSVDLERLEMLQPGDWNSYREYAEELAEQKLDPESRDLAVQLFVLAAHHGDEELRQSCLLALVEIGRNQSETAVFRRLLLLETNATGLPDELRPSSTRTASVQSIRSGNQNLLTIVQKLRMGQSSGVEQLINQSSTLDAIAHQSKKGLADRLRQISRLNRPSLSQLKLLLEIESRLRFQTESTNASPNSSGWSAAFELAPASWVSLPKLETATEFDVSRTVFRNGAWRRP